MVFTYIPIYSHFDFLLYIFTSRSTAQDSFFFRKRKKCFSNEDFVILRKIVLLKKSLSENLREIFKIDYLEEQFSKFDEQAQDDLERVAEILEPENVRKELVKYFGHIDEQMKQFSADIKQWDGENQKVKKSNISYLYVFA